jgi:hypothetical protein
MSTDDKPPVVMVPVKRYDVTLELDDILTPLTQTAANLTQANVGAATDPTVAAHLQRFNDLVSQLKEVTSTINQIDSSLLASKPGPPPSAAASPTPPPTPTS